MPLKLYLDDCADAGLLYDLLSQAGHTVSRPRDANLDGVDDDVHLAHAAQNELILVTKNPADFFLLHQQDQNHHGIFGIYQDNDVTRDMTEADIVAAINKIENTIPHGYVVAGEFHKLNDWR